MEGLTIGRVVHYVPRSGELSGNERPAIVVNVVDKEVGILNAQVILDGPNDGHHAGAKGLKWISSVMYSELPLPGTWHWPERA